MDNTGSTRNRPRLRVFDRARRRCRGQTAPAGRPRRGEWKRRGSCSAAENTAQWSSARS
eukprot:IDg7466t1